MNPASTQYGTGSMKRVKDRLRLMFNEGVGHFALGIVFLTLALTAARVFIAKWSEHQNHVLKTFEEALGTTHEPSFRSEHLGLIGTILAPVNKAPNEWECEAGTRGCEIEQISHTIFLHLIEIILKADGTGTQGVAEDSQLGLSGYIRKQVSKLKPYLSPVADDGFDFGDWSRDAAEDIERVLIALRTRADVNLEDCPLDDPKLSTRIASTGRRGCLPRSITDLTTLIVPPQMDIALERDNSITTGLSGPGEDSSRRGSYGHSSTEPDVAPSYPWRLKRAIHVSSLLENTLQPFLGYAKSEPSRHESQFVQAYLISIDSMLRIWSRRNPKHDEELPASRLWASTNYFEAFWKREEDGSEKPGYHSTAYLDLGGHGIVRTRCSPVPRRANYRSGEFLGAFCTDYTIPESSFLEAISGHPFLEIDEIEFAQSPYKGLKASDINVRAVGSSQNKGAATPGLKQEDEKRARIKSAIADTYELYGHEILQKITEIEYGGRKLFLLPLASSETAGDGPFRGLLIAPTTPEAPAYVIGAGLIACFFGATFIATAVFGAISARRNAHASRRHAVLRNLQVGVVHVDSDDWIIEANDRAEEIFSRKLPKHPNSNFSSINFSYLIENIVFAIDVAENEFRKENLRGVNYAQIGKKRSLGEISKYYARLKAKGRGSGGDSSTEPQEAQKANGWIVVSGSPVLIAEESSRTNEWSRGSSFGVIEEVSGRYAEELELARARYQQMDNES